MIDMFRIGTSSHHVDLFVASQASSAIVLLSGIDTTCLLADKSCIWNFSANFRLKTNADLKEFPGCMGYCGLMSVFLACHLAAEVSFQGFSRQALAE